MLHFSPDTPAWIMDAVKPVLVVHVASGVAAIAAGYVAILARKGEGLHRAAGNVFFVAMLAMLSMGGTIALAEVNRPTAVSAVFSIYLVATAWAAAKRPDGPVGGLERWAVWAVLATGAAEFVLGWMGMNSPDGRIDRLPWQPAFAVGIVALIAAFSDLRVIRNGISGARRIARHLWRMSTALFIASGSFFLGQQKVLPQSWHGSPILVVLAVAPLALMIFWIFRVRLGRTFRSPAPAAQPLRS